MKVVLVHKAYVAEHVGSHSKPSSTALFGAYKVYKERHVANEQVNIDELS